MVSLKYSATAMVVALNISAALILGAPAHAAEPTSTAQANVGLWVVLDAKAGKEEDVAQFLLGGRAIVQDEPATIAWYAVRLSKTQFAIFDTFPDEAGRSAHLAGKVAAALMAKAPELLDHAPTISKIDIMATK
ncbi:putative quinol monooxygenase [Rhizobium leguminosarum]|uniref:putative quinol monooxygenase n=1 Tax=Rhizobium leguminosarum TaxID=384 RepID=UPI003D7C2EC7